MPPRSDEENVADPHFVSSLLNLEDFKLDD
jgi:hypothetical protein